MIDKELEAIVKCHEHLKDLDNDSRMRVFRYLLDRYGLVPAVGATAEHSPLLSESQDPEVVNQSSSVSKEPKISKPKSKTTSTRSNKSGSSQSYSLVTSLNLVSAGSKSLKDFFAEYDAKNNFDYNIIILYYLKNELTDIEVSVNHIYTCYKHLGLKVPNITQSLRDTKNRKGWIDTSNSDDLKVTIAGENYIEHEISKK
ncbi:hypothetical protein [Algoriphagus formosus]|uniref:hypothetical protein n=1 Tax=Algoriphagus formosus TaxID=2007308 RepID=UPI003F6F43F7